MKVSITKPYWDEPIEDEVDEVHLVRDHYGIKVTLKGGKLLGNGGITDDQLIIKVTQ